MEKSIIFGKGSISYSLFSKSLKEFLSIVMSNSILVEGMTNSEQKTKLTELYNSVNGINQNGKTKPNTTEDTGTDNGEIGGDNIQ